MKKDKIHITLLEQGKAKSRKSVKAKSNKKLINYNRILGNLQKGWAIENPGKTVPPELDKEFKTFATNVSGYPSGQRSLPKLNPNFQRYIRLASAPTSKTNPTTPKDLPKVLPPPPPEFFDPKKFLDAVPGVPPVAAVSNDKGFDARAFLKNAPGGPLQPTSTSEFDAKDFLKNAPGNEKSTSFCNDEDLNDPTGVSLKKAHAKLKGKIFAGIEVPGGGFIDFIDYKNAKDLKTDAEMDIADVAEKHNIDTKGFSLSDASLTMIYNHKGIEYNIIQGTGGDLEVLLCSQEELEQDDQAWTAGAPEDPQGDGSEPDYGLSASGAGSAESSKRSRFYRLAKEVTGVEDKFEAVKVIQRALVDMGLLVHRKGALGVVDVSGLKGVELDDSFNPFTRVKREYGTVQLDGVENKSAQWPRDDEKWMVDGIPGKRTRTAVSVFQVFCLSLGFELGATGPKKDGVDGIVGDKTWAAMVTQKNKGNIKSLKPVDSSQLDDTDTETTPAASTGVPQASTPTTPTQDPRTQQSPQSPAVGNTDPDNIFNWYTGIDFFDQNFLLAYRRGNILKMASKTGNVALETKPDSAFADKNPLLYDAYLLYENLDGLGTDNEAQITRIISKYSLPIDKFIEDAHEGLGIEDTAKALANSDEWFNKINMTGFGLFSSFSQAYFTGHAIYYAYNGRLALEEDTSSGGLIKWLIDDGMDKEAQMLRQRIKAERYVASELNRVLASSEQAPDDGSPSEFLIKTIRRAAAIQNSNISKNSLSKNDSGQDTQQEPPGGFGPNFVRDRETRRFRPSRPGEG